MKAILKSKTGEKEIELPLQFNEPIRQDLIKRAVLAIHSHKRQPYGTDPEAGKKHSSKLSRRRRDYKTAYGIGISRVPRKILSHSGSRFNWVAAAVPYAVGGMQAHPPKAEKKWAQKINDKERRKAIRSAMAASVNKELVLKRGHKIKELKYPLVLEDEIENISKAKEALEMLLSLGLEDELKRCSKYTQRSGKATTRGRTQKSRKGPLIVVSKKCNLMKAVRNIPGVDVVEVKNLNAELLAPGADIGRLTVYTNAAIELLKNENLFLDNKLKLENKIISKETEEKKKKETTKNEKIKKETKSKKIKEN
ncbi:MAG: 50S ribosomal protein L4 [Candidatus Woesearchaeota archaeon]